MILVTSVYPLGTNLAGWRHEFAYDRPTMNLDSWIDFAVKAEEGGFHSLFLADGNAVRTLDRPMSFERTTLDRPASFEPLTVMAAISQHTEQIGLFVTATTTYDEPWFVARRMASLDHISRGRATWNIVTGAFAGDALNFSMAEHVGRSDRYERAGEFVEICKSLWDSTGPDPLPQDKDSGQFAAQDRFRPINHAGKYFQVVGPLNIPRPPQGWPVLFAAGQSEPGRDLAAQHADCLFASAQTKEQCKELYDDMRERALRFGRRPEDIRILPGVQLYIGETRDEARALSRELAALIDPTLGMDFLSRLLQVDLSQFDPDAPFPEMVDDVVTETSMRRTMWELARGNRWTLREAFRFWLGGDGGLGVPALIGTASDIADELEEWLDYGACDGFNLGFPTVPHGIERWNELVAPELRRRGLLPERHEGATLRERMGLRIPDSVWDAAS